VLRDGWWQISFPKATYAFEMKNDTVIDSAPYGKFMLGWNSSDVISFAVRNKADLYDPDNNEIYRNGESVIRFFQ